MKQSPLPFPPLAHNTLLFIGTLVLVSMKLSYQLFLTILYIHRFTEDHRNKKENNLSSCSFDCYNIKAMMIPEGEKRKVCIRVKEDIWEQGWRHLCVQLSGKAKEIIPGRKQDWSSFYVWMERARSKRSSSQVLLWPYSRPRTSPTLLPAYCQPGTDTSEVSLKNRWKQYKKQAA